VFALVLRIRTHEAAVDAHLRIEIQDLFALNIKAESSMSWIMGEPSRILQFIHTLFYALLLAVSYFF
jgi:hypothetical protein